MMPWILAVTAAHQTVIPTSCGIAGMFRVMVKSPFMSVRPMKFEKIAGLEREAQKRLSRSRGMARFVVSGVPAWPRLQAPM